MSRAATGFPRARYRVQNWPEYDCALQQRGNLTVWVAPEALAAWQPPRTGQRGRPREYSDVAIETGHLLRLAFGRPWRQTEGLLRSIVGLLGLEVGVPDHTTFARRSPGLELAAALARAQAASGGGPIQVVIDATGLKVYGAGEWLAEKQGERDRREWRKLHIAVDPDSGEVLACELTSSEEGDASQVAPLLAQISGSLGAVIADGAYDGEPVYRAVAERQPDPSVAMVIPPRATAVPSTEAETAPSQRDQHLRLIRERGRLGWQRAVGYGRRSLGETAMFRYKALIGPSLRARSLPAQKTEARVGCTVLNRMTGLGMPVSQRIT
jgi:Transposase DDE domain